MSSTENESGPFVVFFLPAVVGCLTILLARRWASAQASTGSTTAFSRRRKIYKDPLIKRPLPPVTPKMMPPQKKASSAARKRTPLEEESYGNGPTKFNQSKKTLTASPSNNDAKAVEDVSPPKHIPFPEIPQEGDLLFEVMTFVFLMVATFLQYLNLYRTIWWHSNSFLSQSMNFHLIDPHIVAFIVIVLSRRVVYAAAAAVLGRCVDEAALSHALSAARMFTLGVLVGALSWCLYFIVQKYPLLKLFYLCYPAILYLILFGWRSGALLAPPPEAPRHACPRDAAALREEVAAMRADFNDRLKRTLFGSVIGAYYSCFVPCCFAQSYVYYEWQVTGVQTALVWCAGGARLAARLGSARCCDAAHRAARHLGEWRVERPRAGAAAAPAWHGGRVWARGERAWHAGATHEAASAAAAEPAARAHRRFYAVFKNPSTLLCVMMCLQLSLIIVNKAILFSAIPWNGYISIFLLLFMNYYTLFKLARDYLVAFKVYDAENVIQDKMDSSVN